MTDTANGNRVVWSREAEEGVISCAMLEPAEVVSGCIERGLTGGSFWLDGHRLVWEAIAGLWDRGEEIDEVMVCSVLSATGNLDSAGGAAEVMRLGGRVDVAYRWPAYCRVVLDRALQRRAIGLAEKVGMLAREPSEEFAEMAGRLQGPLTELGELGLAEDNESLRDVSAKMLERAELIEANGGYDPEGGRGSSTRGVVGTPWSYFNANYLPFTANDDGIVIVAARPSVGKSAWVRNIMGHAVGPMGLNVVGFLLEMTRPQWLDLMAAERAGVNLRLLQEEPRDRLAGYSGAHRWLNGIVDERLYLFDRDMAIEQIEARCRYLKSRLGDIGLVVIDYLQLVEAEGDNNKWMSRENVVSNISRRLKKLQKELGCVFLVACQINRDSERGERDPKLSDLRESGAIEQDADRVIFLHRPKLDHLGNAQGPGRKSMEISVIQAKNRNGPCYKSRFLYLPPTTTFKDYPGSAKISERPEQKRTKKVAKMSDEEREDLF